MANQLTNYLAKFKTEKNGNITHTRIGDKKLNIYPGSYNIPDENHLEFMEMYYNWVIVAGNDEYLTEKQDKDEGVIALDFDFRYDTSIKTRQHKEEHIIDMLCLYMDKLNELCDIPDDTTIIAYVMHKPNPNCLNDKTKDGIHIIIDAKLNRNAQKIMRLMLLNRLKQLWEDLPITNDWSDVVDEGVVNASVNWQLYGSNKPSNETYKLTSKYEFKLQNDGFEPKRVEINNALSFDEFLKLSVQSGGDYILHIKDIHKEDIENHFKQTNQTNTGLLTPPPEQNKIINNNYDNELTDILDNIDIKYWSSFDSWKQLILSISTIDDKKEATELALKYSKKTTNDNYDEEAVLKLLEVTTDKITKATIYYYSKLSNKDNFYKIKAKYQINFDITDYSIAETYIKLIGDNIKICNKIPYIYEGRLWSADTDKKKIQRNIVKTLLEFYEKCNSRYMGLLKNINTDDDRYDKYTKTLNKINDILFSIKSDSKQNSILKQVLLFIEDEKEDFFDKVKPQFFVFNNTAFDMFTGEEVKIDKYDYITQSAGYNYEKPTEEKVNKMKKLIEEILTDEDTRNCYLSVLKSCCVGIRQEKFILANGAGRNGKGIISQLMRIMLGNEYYYQGNCCTLTQQIKSGANPEIANMDKKRMVMFSEPEENASLYLGVIKALTGEDTTNARGLYSSKTETTLVPTIILEVNGKPNINGKINDSAIERWININFRNLYTDNDEIVDNVRIFKQNTLYKQQSWRLEMRCALFEMLKDFQHNTIIMPKSVRSNTLDYLLENDSILKWFNQHYKIVNENKDENIFKISDIYNFFKESDFYINLSKKQKREDFSKKGFIDKIKENVKLKAYYHDRKKINDIDYRSILTHIEQNEEEQNNDIDC